MKILTDVDETVGCETALLDRRDGSRRASRNSPRFGTSPMVPRRVFAHPCLAWELAARAVSSELLTSGEVERDWIIGRLTIDRSRLFSRQQRRLTYASESGAAGAHHRRQLTLRCGDSLPPAERRRLLRGDASRPRREVGARRDGDGTRAE